jgi:methylated-DNA-[protein]-cysteine S-methyltransferase
MEFFVDAVSTPVGEVVLISQGNRLYALEFDNGQGGVVGRMRRRFREPNFIFGKDVFGFAARLGAWFRGDLRAVEEIAVETGGREFQQRVWAAVRAIAPGETRTYGQIAAGLGSPRLARAVGQANARNPVAIVIPCHRVIGSGGKLTGYAAGIHRKRWLLDHERDWASRAREGRLWV